MVADADPPPYPAFQHCRAASTLTSSLALSVHVVWCATNGHTVLGNRTDNSDHTSQNVIVYMPPISLELTCADHWIGPIKGRSKPWEAHSLEDVRCTCLVVWKLKHKWQPPPGAVLRIPVSVGEVSKVSTPRAYSTHIPLSVCEVLIRSMLRAYWRRNTRSLDTWMKQSEWWRVLGTFCRLWEPRSQA